MRMNSKIFSKKISKKNLPFCPPAWNLSHPRDLVNRCDSRNRWRLIIRKSTHAYLKVQRWVRVQARRSSIGSPGNSPHPGWRARGSREVEPGFLWTAKNFRYCSPLRKGSPEKLCARRRWRPRVCFYYEIPGSHWEALHRAGGETSVCGSPATRAPNDEWVTPSH